MSWKAKSPPRNRHNEEKNTHGQTHKQTQRAKNNVNTFKDPSEILTTPFSECVLLNAEHFYNVNKKVFQNNNIKLSYVMLLFRP